MGFDDLRDNEAEQFEPLGVHQGAEEILRRNYNIEMELSMHTTIADGEEGNFSPSDEELDEALEGVGGKVPQEPRTVHWIDDDEFYAWYNEDEVDRFNEDARSITVIVKFNSKYAKSEQGDPSEWIRALSSQRNLGSTRRIIREVDEALQDIGMRVLGAKKDENDLSDFSFLTAHPQDEIPLWQEYLMEQE